MLPLIRLPWKGSIRFIWELPSAVEFWYEYSEEDDPASQWYRTYGIEHWVL